MLGFSNIGSFALGQLPTKDAVAAGAVLRLDLTFVPGVALGSGDAVAFGVTLPLTLTFVPGAAIGEQAITFQLGGGRAPTWRDAIVRGVRFELEVALLPGRAFGEQYLDAVARGAALRFIVGIDSGAATGDAIGYDNEFLLLAA
jgi:hypothetical protein